MIILSSSLGYLFCMRRRAMDKDIWWLDDLSFFLTSICVPVLLILAGLFGHKIGLPADLQQQILDVGLFGFGLGGKANGRGVRKENKE